MTVSISGVRITIMVLIYFFFTIMPLVMNDQKPPAAARARVDLVSGDVLCHVSYLLSHLLPKWMVVRRIKEQSEALQAIWRDIYRPTDLSNIVFAGSVSDAINVPDCRPRRRHDDDDDGEAVYDVDILYMTDITAGYGDRDLADYAIDTSDTYPGYFRLTKNGRLVEVSLEPSGDNVKEEMDFQIFQECAREIGCEPQGPALTLKDPELDVDLVYTGVCLSWPPEASGFFGRATLAGWPSDEMKRRIRDGGCHFVCKAHASSSKPEAEYRFSFIMAEKLLLESLSDGQRQCYVIFKMLIKDALKPYSAISSYCLKTTLFWTLEKIPRASWDDPIHGLATGFLGLLDTLIDFVARRCIPQYFITDSNLVVHVGREHLRGSLQELVKLRRRPVDVLLKFDDAYELYGSLREPMRCHLVNTMARLRGRPSEGATIEDCLIAHLEDTVGCLKHSLTARNMAGSLHLMARVRQYEAMTGRPPMAFLPLIDRQLDSMAEAASSRPVVDFLALLSSIVFLKELDGRRRADGERLVDRAFGRALANRHEDGLGHLYYGMFLEQCGRRSEAKSMLRKALTLPATNTVVCEYFCEMADTLVDVLRVLRSQYVLIAATCHAMCYFLLIDMLMDEDDVDEARRLADEFDERGESMLSPRCRFVDRTLVAFAFFLTGQLLKAEEAFVLDEVTSGEMSKFGFYYASICRRLLLDAN